MHGKGNAQAQRLNLAKIAKALFQGVVAMGPVSHSSGASKPSSIEQVFYFSFPQADMYAPTDYCNRTHGGHESILGEDLASG